MRDVFLTGAGAFLPGAPVGNAEMSAHIGDIDDLSDRLGRLTLRQNKIETRHYAIDGEGAVTHSNAQMSALAIKAAIGNSEISPGDVDFLAAATTQGDLLVPGHASAVHAEFADLTAARNTMEIANFQSVCASSMMAAKAA